MSSIKIKKPIKSQQADYKTGELLIDLKEGDDVELREDGIYFTRRITLPHDSLEYSKDRRKELVDNEFQKLKKWNGDS